MIKAILACDEEGGVGRNGQMPWSHIPIDFQWFMDQTKGHVMVMGRTTWQDSQLGHPVPDRLSYVVTGNPDVCSEADGVIQGDIVQRILDLQYIHPRKTIWIIGGATLIEATLSIIDEFVLSRIPGTYGCDRFLPLKDLNEWSVVWEEQHPEVTFQRLQKIRPFNGFLSHRDDFYACLQSFFIQSDEDLYKQWNLQDEVVPDFGFVRPAKESSGYGDAFDTEMEHNEYLYWMFCRQDTLEQMNVYNREAIQKSIDPFVGIMTYVDYAYDDEGGSYADVYVSIDNGTGNRDAYVIDWGEAPSDWYRLPFYYYRTKETTRDPSEHAFGPDVWYEYSFEYSDLQPRDWDNPAQYKDRLWLVHASRFPFLVGQRQRYDLMYEGNLDAWRLGLEDTLEWIDVFFPLCEERRVVSAKLQPILPFVMHRLYRSDGDYRNGWSIHWNQLKDFAIEEYVEGLNLADCIFGIPKDLLFFESTSTDKELVEHVQQLLKDGLTPRTIDGHLATTLLVAKANQEVVDHFPNLKCLIVLDDMSEVVRLPTSLTHLYVDRWNISYGERTQMVRELPNLRRLIGVFTPKYGDYKDSEVSSICEFVIEWKELMDSEHWEKVLELLSDSSEYFMQARVLLEGLFPSFEPHFATWMSLLLDENLFDLSEDRLTNIASNWEGYKQGHATINVVSGGNCDVNCTMVSLTNETDIDYEWCPNLTQITIPKSSSLRSVMIKDCRSLTGIDGLEYCTKLSNLEIYGRDFTMENVSEEWKIYEYSYPKGDLDMDYKRLARQIQQLESVRYLTLSDADFDVLMIPRSVEVLKLYNVRFQEIHFAENAQLRDAQFIDCLDDLSPLENLAHLEHCSVRTNNAIVLPANWPTGLRSLSLWGEQLVSDNDRFVFTPNLRRLHMKLKSNNFALVHFMYSWIGQLQYCSVQIDTTYHLVQKGKFIPDSFDRLINAMVLTETETKPSE